MKPPVLAMLALMAMMAMMAMMAAVITTFMTGPPLQLRCLQGRREALVPAVEGRSGTRV